MRLLSNGTDVADIDILKGIRELRAIVTYEGPDGYYLLTDETNNELITEKDLDYIGTERERINIKEDSIISVRYNCKASHTKTICKMIELNTKFNISVGKEITLKIGCKWDYDNEYYYADIGRFYVKESEYDPDTNSYILTCYDKMYESMIKYDGDINLTFPCTHREFLEAIFDKFGWNYTSQSYTNAEFDSIPCYSDNAIIEKDIYEGLDMTYRDVIDDLAITYGALYFDERDILTVKNYAWGGTAINYEFLNQQTVNITNPYEWSSSNLVNKVTLTNSEGMTYVICDDPYMTTGKEYDIGNNIFVQHSMNNIDDYTDVQNDLNYLLISLDIDEPAEIDTTGILIAEPLDKLYIYDMEGTQVKTITVLEDNFILDRGLEETITVEEQEEVKKDYVTSSPTTSDIKNAIINIDKANGQIVLKVTSDDKLAQVALNADADSGTEVSINADSINFNSHTFDLTTDSINISSTNFSVDDSGYLVATSGQIAGWNIDDESMYSDYGNNRVYIQKFLQQYGLDSWIFSVQEISTGIGKFYVSGRGDIVANNIDSGECYLSSAGDSNWSFNKTFTNVPSVVITPISTTVTGVIAPKLRNITTTGFTATLGGSVDGGNDVKCYWIAIGQ